MLYTRVDDTYYFQEDVYGDILKVSAEQISLHPSKNLPVDDDSGSNGYNGHGKQFISGIFGIIKLKIATYIILIKDVVNVGILFNSHVVFTIKIFHIVPTLLAKIVERLISNDPDENYYFDLFRNQLNSECFYYFSCSLDYQIHFKRQMALLILLKIGFILMIFYFLEFLCDEEID